MEEPNSGIRLMESGCQSVPDFVLDGQVWTGINNGIFAYVIPIANEQFWHVATINRKTLEKVTTRRAVSSECISYYLTEGGMNLGETIWLVTKDYSPIGPDGKNPLEVVGLTTGPKKPERYFVYFIRAVGTNLVKIGSAKHPRLRLDNLQVGCPHRLVIEAAIISTPQESESTFHRRFSKYHHRGEWFKREGDLESFLDSLQREKRQCLNESK